MSDIFENYLRSVMPLTQEELQQILSLSVTKKVRRRQLLLEEGEVCLYKIFITKGLLKSYLLKSDGSEHIMRFAPEQTWLTDHESYMHQTPSKYFIEAIEDTHVLLWTRDHFNMLMDNIPALKAYSIRIVSNSLNASQERIRMHISATSEEKYQEFVAAFPQLANRIPLHLIASYLGVSRETLSRIRHAQRMVKPS
ncbi:CRP-like cAMP-binding protein [Chitinophaga polysaccharea]|uniref:CRP-like cAMP-binding protein n=1 Tax=Chitinophaga polysaccharea TaxID=1293035 RepID=A0A561PXN6_9BACT|nr:Crp/Fnr family transcriptional regulator [Chitinophaga polysaccharea]TWF42884.1 CRP-like cAMP-binding protein [Chitinophaga polysaccharea]